jgi:hypothetical protein
MFRKLCGADSLQNIVIATTFWDKVDGEEGVAKIKELKTNVNLFQPVVAAGGKIMRHDKGLLSAHSILDAILSNKPRPVLIQEEMAQGKSLEETSAGSELNATLMRLIESLQKEIKEIQEDRRKDNEAHKKELQVLGDKIADLQHEKERILTVLNTKPKGRNRFRELFKFRRGKKRSVQALY